METNNWIVCNFYQQNPSLSFEECNIALVRFLEKVIDRDMKPNDLSIMNYKSMENIQNTFIDGVVIENYIESILNKLYPTSKTTYIDNRYQLFFRENKSKIIIENKNSQKNIDEEDSTIFVDYMKEKKYNGIFVSHNSGIYNKENFEINIHNGNIIVYVHNLNQNEEKIKTAIDIIDNLHLKLKEFNGNNNQNNIHISKEILNEINNEYQEYANKKEKVIEFIKESTKTLLNKMEDMQFVALDKYLSTKFISTKKQPKYRCNMCEIYCSNTLKGIAAHKRGCKKKIHNNIQSNNMSNTSNNL